MDTRWTVTKNSFTISDVCKDCTAGGSDLMTIQCNATNSFGFALAEGYLNVLGKGSVLNVE